MVDLPRRGGRRVSGDAELRILLNPAGSGADPTPCADATAKRSLKESEGSAGTVAGAEIRGGDSTRAICEATGAMRAAKLADGAATCASNLALSSRG